MNRSCLLAARKSAGSEPRVWSMTLSLVGAAFGAPPRTLHASPVARSTKEAAL